MRKLAAAGTVGAVATRHATDDTHRPASLPADAAAVAADGTGPQRSTAAQRRVRAAEDGLAGLASLDGICLEDHLCRRVRTLEGAPSRLRGPLRSALRTGFNLVSERTSPQPQDELRAGSCFT